MSNKNDGGPAFPRTLWTGSDKNMSHRDVKGMSVRDFFAYGAMKGILSNSTVNLAIADDGVLEKKAYLIADAMLKERDNE